MLPNWRPPRRRAFFAHRGVALLRAWRLRAAEERREPYIQTHFAFESGVFSSEKKSVMGEITLAEYDQGSVEWLNWPAKCAVSTSDRQHSCGVFCQGVEDNEFHQIS